jgi:formylglycine-generating enzyme required for sulfatase activity
MSRKVVAYLILAMACASVGDISARDLAPAADGGLTGDHSRFISFQPEVELKKSVTSDPAPVVGVSEVIPPLTAEQEHALKPKDTFRECNYCPEMVVVPAGSFTIGSPQSEGERDKFNESPQHEVTFARPFAAGKYAVTFDEWDDCVADGGCNGFKPDDRGWGRGRMPVINVTWSDAKAYAAWLSQKTGKPYRLLSEAEREYVTRAGTTTPFWWGSEISPNMANYYGNTSSSFGTEGAFRRRTMPVDSFSPNPWGFYQVHGNVWEWTEDCYRSYRAVPSDGSAWTFENCNKRVLRGGSWISLPKFLRSAFRFIYDSADGGDAFGLRVARSLDP